ncbi:MAG: T9SS type A sorting domain-containing protein [Bacteroidales bacterium]|nr:T9SS type A sorting domain-containing protein [Bacteroidales bacterium]
MKKSLLLLFALGIGLVAFAQNPKADLKMMPAKANKYAQEPAAEKRVMPPSSVAVTSPAQSPMNTNVVTQIPIGQSGNAFGFFVDSRTASVWVDNSMNTVAFTHRLATPSSSYVGYDISKDGGTTWELNNINYDPTVAGFSNARYPQGGIYNPAGNTNPDNAYHTYLAPALDGSQGTAGSWGGIVWGAKAFAPGATAAQNILATTDEYRWLLPDAFTITQPGTAWFIDEEVSWDGAASTYLGNLNIGKGTFNEATEDFDYEYFKYPLDVNAADGINDIEIAFAPDGQTGYICVLTNLVETLPFTSYHPVFLKTTDGGETWSDPIEVQLGGVDGLEAVKNFITDEYLAAYFDPNPVPPRDEIAYYIGYHHDLSVDAWGNPHISGDVMIADLEAGTIATGAGFFGMFHIWSPDGGTTWNAFKLGDPLQFGAEFTGGGSTVSQYNRPQVATTTDGSIVFFSWLDSDIEEATDNSRPNIYFRDFIPYEGEGGTHGAEVVNVTLFSAAMWTANWGTMPCYVFSKDLGENTIECTIPFVYQKMDNYDPSLPTQFYYIPDFKQTYTISGIGDKRNTIASVSQNYPNPFSSETNINVNLVKGGNIGLEVFNMTGQKVFETSTGYHPAGTVTLKMNAEGLTSGIYFYTVSAGGEKITRKMLVN